MRLAALSIPLLTMALAGCQALAPAPDVATIAHAAIAGTHVDTNGDRVDTFRALAIDGRNVLPITDQPARLIGVDATQLVPAGRSVRVEIEGLAIYRNTARRLFWDPMHVQGAVDFVPTADARYSLHGSISPEVSSVWIENDATHEIVAAKVSAAGRGAPPADAASAAAQ
jgi:hypothetical protein